VWPSNPENRIEEPDNQLVLHTLLRSTDFSEKVSASFVHIQGLHRPLITHSELRIYLVVSGSIDFLLNATERVSLTKGDALTINAGTLYQLEGEGEYYVLNVPGFQDGDDVYL
jgi:mannose-6-phosphate isomerase-like protein (cupin superfamily)